MPAAGLREAEHQPVQLAAAAASAASATSATVAASGTAQPARLPARPAPEPSAEEGVAAAAGTDLADHVPAGQAPGMGEVIQRLHQAGIRSGLGAFNPPGTRPPLIGLAVPPDFALPEGYVRHHQSTDDGQDIEPILMFAPDRVLYDATGRTVEMPKDRVVPPELAPPGLPLRRIVVPPPLAAASAARP